MIIEKNKLKIGIVAVIVFIVIGLGSAIFVNSTIKAKNTDKENSLINNMVQEISKDLHLMSQEQIEKLETLKEEQDKNYNKKNINGLKNVKKKLKEFKEIYPGVILASVMFELSSLDLPPEANQAEKDKLLGIKSEVEKGIADNNMSLDSRVELIKTGIKQGNEIILGVTNRIIEEKKQAAILKNTPKVVNKASVVRSNPEIATAQLNVSVIKQRPELLTGCEVTSLAMLLNYIGAPVTKLQLAQEIPYHSSNPNLGFVGSPYEASGYTIYPPALMNIMQKYAGSSVNLTGQGTNSIKNSIDSGKPVIAWVRISGFYLHCVLITGYNNDGFFYNDPWSGAKNKYISNSAFETAWKAIGYRAMSY